VFDHAEPLNRQAPALLRPSQRLGLVSFVLGGLALPAASLSWLALLAIPLAGLGAVFGVVGLVGARKEQGRASLSALGLAACLLGLFVGARSIRAWVPSGKGAGKKEDKEQQVVRLRGPEAASRSGWPNALCEAVQTDGVRVRLVRASTQAVPIEDRAGGRRWAERGLMLHVRVSNMASDRLVRFAGWGLSGTEAEAITVVDDQGRPCSARTFEPGWAVLGRAGPAVLAGGKWVDDVLVFAPPSPDVAFLRLTLPASAFGGTGSLRLEVPREMIEFR
jgi:hypothetical protein